MYIYVDMNHRYTVDIDVATSIHRIPLSLSLYPFGLAFVSMRLRLQQSLHPLPRTLLCNAQRSLGHHFKVMEVDGENHWERWERNQGNIHFVWGKHNNWRVLRWKTHVSTGSNQFAGRNIELNDGWIPARGPCLRMPEGMEIHH